MGQMNAMAQAYQGMAEAMYEDRVTFNISSITKSSSGGNIVGSPSPVASSIPCRPPRPASGKEIQSAGKTIAGTAYVIAVPAMYQDELVEVDSECTAVVAARNGGEVSRTFNVVAPLRKSGIEIEVLATIES